MNMCLKDLWIIGYSTKPMSFAQLKEDKDYHYWYSQRTDLSLWRLQAEDNPFDIKPQNIMLDDDFNAKTSDFELSKLFDRDQSKVVTIMRGTLAYLAPK